MTTRHKHRGARDNCPSVRTEFLINAPRFVSALLGWNKVFQRGSASYNGRRIGGVIRRLLLRATLLARQRSKGGIPRRQESTKELLPGDKRSVTIPRGN